MRWLDVEYLDHKRADRLRWGAGIVAEFPATEPRDGSDCDRMRVKVKKTATCYYVAEFSGSGAVFKTFSVRLSREDQLYKFRDAVGDLNERMTLGYHEEYAVRKQLQSERVAAAIWTDCGWPFALYLDRATVLRDAMGARLREYRRKRYWGVTRAIRASSEREIRALHLALAS